MKIKIIAVGKLKEKYWEDACKEYIKRLSSYCDLEIIEVKESKLPGKNTAEEEQIKKEEGEAIISKIVKGKTVKESKSGSELKSGRNTKSVPSRGHFSSHPD